MGWRYEPTRFKCTDPDRTAAFFREVDLSEPGTKFPIIAGPDGMSMELLQRD